MERPFFKNAIFEHISKAINNEDVFFEKLIDGWRKAGGRPKGPEGGALRHHFHNRRGKAKHHRHRKGGNRQPSPTTK